MTQNEDLTAIDRPVDAHKHQWRFVPPSMSPIKAMDLGGKSWYRCVAPNCGAMTLRTIKRKSKTRGKKKR